MKTFWEYIAMLVFGILIVISPFGWMMADNRVILQVLVIAVYAFLFWIMHEIIKEVFNK